MIKMEVFLRYMKNRAQGKNTPTPKGLAFCAGYSQTLSQFDVVRNITHIEHWATIDINPVTNPLVEGDVSDVNFLRTLPQGIWDAVYLPHCPYFVYLSHKKPDLAWLAAVKDLLAPEGMILFNTFMLHVLVPYDPVALIREIRETYQDEEDGPLLTTYKQKVRELLDEQASFAVNQEGVLVTLLPK